MAFAVTESQAAGAVAIPGRAAMLAVSQESRMLIAAESLVTFSVKDVEAEPGIDTPIAITLPSDAELRGAGAEEGTFLLIRNIPEGVSVSAGMATSRICIVPLREASALRLISKPGANARFQLEFHLIGPDSRLLAETIISVNLRPLEVVGALDPASPEPVAAPPPPIQPPPPAAQLTPQAEAVLLARGKDLLQQGDIAAARLIFEDMAKYGSAAGALALARSYDPAYVPKSAVSAPAPDLAEARKWYERAAELGDADAKRRLTEIALGG
jgi:hypothetical protein